MTPNPAPASSNEQTSTPDPVRAPGRHLIHQRTGATRPRDLLDRAQQLGSPALAVIAAQATDTASRLDATAQTLARKITTGQEWLTRLAAGARITPCFASSAMTTLGAEIDLTIHHQDLLREQLHQLLDVYTQLTAATAAR